jgi:hypothetical protein
LTAGAGFHILGGTVRRSMPDDRDRREELKRLTASVRCSG